MYVFKIIQRMFRHMFPPRTVETINLLLEEADVIMKDIKSSKTLSQLLHVKAVLQKFRGAVEMAGSPQVVKNKLVFLEAQWNKQFRIWKSKG